jgi:hypothetical protein
MHCDTTTCSVQFSPGLLEVQDVTTSWGQNIYLAYVSGTVGIAKPIIIETEKNLRILRSGYTDLLYQNLNLELAGYGSYTQHGIDVSTYRFHLYDE